MPLLPGASNSTISHNIREMIAHGHSHAQAVAVALSNARNHSRGFTPKHFAMGGMTANFSNAPHLDVGGMPSSSEMAPWYVRQAERGTLAPVHESGLLNSSVPGRTDQLNRIVPAGAYVVPADVVSGLGEGNTQAGANIMQRVIGTGPHGTALPGARGHMGPPRVSPPPAYHEPAQNAPFARGGAPGGHVPVVLAGGEFVIHPEDVRRLGGGNIKKGHRILDAFVVHARKQIVKETSKLPGPKK